MAMLQRAIGAFMVLLLAGCGHSANESTAKNGNTVPELGKADGAKEPMRHAEKLHCKFANPDTSVYGISIRNARSAGRIIGNSRADGLGEYHFYSKLERETLTLVQHPGDVEQQISIFKIAYSDKASYNFRQLAADTFKTESGIKLGMTTRQVVAKLGSCYAKADSAGSFVGLYYKIEQPSDSQTKLLARNSMPFYYASYKFCDNKLQSMEFGFEYP